MPEHEHEEFGVVTWSKGKACPACEFDRMVEIKDRLLELHKQKDAVVQEAIDKLLARSGSV